MRKSLLSKSERFVYQVQSGKIRRNSPEVNAAVFEKHMKSISGWLRGTKTVFDEFRGMFPPLCILEAAIVNDDLATVRWWIKNSFLAQVLQTPHTDAYMSVAAGNGNVKMMCTLYRIGVRAHANTAIGSAVGFFLKSPQNGSALGFLGKSLQKGKACKNGHLKAMILLFASFFSKSCGTLIC